MNPNAAARERLENFAKLQAELRRREERDLQGDPYGGLFRFVQYFWPIVEPARPLIVGWPLEAICEHLEAVTRGEIRRLCISIPPGFMKSLTANVFWPAFEWGPMNLPSNRFIAASYSQSLTVRDNVRFRNIIMSPEYQRLYGDRFAPSKDQFNIVKVANDKTGWKLATSVGGVGTGERADRFVVDDGNSVKEAESDVVRESTNQWFTEVVPTRLNDAETGVIVNIQQRTNEDDITGMIMSRDLGYDLLRIPMEYDGGFEDNGVKRATSIGWTDPRTYEGELAWPERFSARAVAELKKIMGPYAVSGQFQQIPSPRGGGIIQREYWQEWTEANFPALSYVWASADTAYTEKEGNDPTGFTCWGLWSDKGQPKVIMLTAWRKRLEIHGPSNWIDANGDPQSITRLKGETFTSWVSRTQGKWGLCEWLAYSCNRFGCHKLLIEAKASGHSVAQELYRLHGSEGWGIELVTPDGDKTARLYSVQATFAAGLVYTPFRDWSQEVIDEVSSYPKHKFDDLTDSTSQALKHIRDIGLLIRPEERQHTDEMMARHKPKLEPLYPA